VKEPIVISDSSSEDNEISLPSTTEETKDAVSETELPDEKLKKRGRTVLRMLGDRKRIKLSALIGERNVSTVQRFQFNRRAEDYRWTRPRLLSADFWGCESMADVVMKMQTLCFDDEVIERKRQEQRRKDWEIEKWKEGRRKSVIEGTMETRPLGVAACVGPDTVFFFVFCLCFMSHLFTPFHSSPLLASLLLGLLCRNG
jgi:hypothetical protein